MRFVFNVGAMAELRPRILDVLVIDASAAVRAAVALCLGRAGHRVTPAASRQEALAALAGQYFELIVTAMVMPDGNALELIDDVKKRFPSTRILVMSEGGNALAPAHRAELAAMMGAHAALVKPFTGGELLDALALMIPPSETSAPFRREPDDRIRSMIIQ